MNKPGTGGHKLLDGANIFLRDGTHYKNITITKLMLETDADFSLKSMWEEFQKEVNPKEPIGLTGFTKTEIQEILDSMYSTNSKLDGTGKSKHYNEITKKLKEDLEAIELLDEKIE